MKTDKLTRELERLDPVKAGELDGAEKSADAAALLDRIASADPEASAPLPRLDPEPAPDVRKRRRPAPPRLAFAGGATAAAAAAVLLIAGVFSSGSGGDPLTAALDNAAAAAGSHSAAGAPPYTYLKTREMSVDTTDADQRSWKVYQSTTREEWVTRDGSGRLRIVAGPSRFVGSDDRAEWEGAGRPSFLTLGFGGHTEERWLAAGMLRGGVTELPTEPAALAARLREEAKAEDGDLPIAAATLQLIAEDLRNPVATPALRRALYKAAKRVPGVEYQGEKADPDGRAGVAIGISRPTASGPTLYSLIFDPDTAQVFATETSSLEAGGPTDAEAATLQRATVYVEARGVEALSENEGTWLSDLEPSAAWGGQPTNLRDQL